MLERIIDRVNGGTAATIGVLLIAYMWKEHFAELYALAVIIASMSGPKYRRGDDDEMSKLRRENGSL
jgi:hypothetical protein